MSIFFFLFSANGRCLNISYVTQFPPYNFFRGRGGGGERFAIILYLYPTLLQLLPYYIRHRMKFERALHIYTYQTQISINDTHKD